MFHDDGDIQPHKRAHVAREHAVAARDQDHLVHGGQIRHHLLDPRVLGARLRFHPLKQADLGVIRKTGKRIRGFIKPQPAAAAPGDGYGRLSSLTRNRARRGRRFQQGRHHDLIGIGETRLFPADRAHAHALFDVVAAGFYPALFQRPRLMAAVLKIEIGIIHAAGHKVRHQALKFAFADAGGIEQGFPGLFKSAAHTKFFLCRMLGRLSRVCCRRSEGQSAITTPDPRASRSSTSPQGLTIMLSPWVSRPLTW